MSCVAKHPNETPVHGSRTSLVLIFDMYSSNIAASPHQMAKGAGTSKRIDIPNNLFPSMKVDTCGTPKNIDAVVFAGGGCLNRVLSRGCEVKSRNPLSLVCFFEGHSI